MNADPKYGAFAIIAIILAVALALRSCSRYNLGYYTLHLDGGAFAAFGFSIYFIFRAIGWIN